MHILLATRPALVKAVNGEYEPGEFCPHADAGMTGVAGDGKTITCELAGGYYRWED